MNKQFVASLLLCSTLAAGSAFAQEVKKQEAPSESPASASVPKEALLLNELKLAAVKYRATVADAVGGQDVALPEESKLRDWLDAAVGQLGFKVTGAAADPAVEIETECAGGKCVSRLTVAREVFVKKVVGKRDSYVRLPKATVAEFKAEKSYADNQKGSAAYVSLHDVLLAFATAVSDANK